jgi:UDP-3-O-[3-hydroxymyristoyl] N-acetylglucosamine deacetylase / 3-hydroxyacyl-[acyl-carrier-protein] dehydratase
LNPLFNPERQHTLALEVNLSGYGLHTGVFAHMSLIPAAPGFGFQFRRIDLAGKPYIKADCDLVTDTFRNTTLSSANAKVSAVEHILAALVGMGIDNCLIEIDSQEIPSVDGSCDFFVKMIKKAGVLEQDEVKIWYAIDTPILYENSEKNILIEAFPAPEYSIATKIDFSNPRLGLQTASISSMKGFEQEIAPCRTFCYVHELEMLLSNNLIKGDILHKAILVMDKPVDQEHLAILAQKFGVEKFSIRNETYLDNLDLRFSNEIARHKLLDMIGDLSLIGFPIKAQIKGYRQGHASNNEFARRVKRHINKMQMAAVSASL